MAKSKNVSVTSKGQITLSVAARKQLGLQKGDKLNEIVAGRCVILVPQNEALEQAETKAQAVFANCSRRALDEE